MENIHMQKKQISFRINPQTYEKFEEHKRVTKESTSFICAIAVTEYLTNYEKQPRQTKLRRQIKENLKEIKKLTNEATNQIEKTEKLL